MKRWRIIYYSGLLLITGMLINSIANAETVAVSNQNIDVVLDIDHCAQAGAVLCGGSGSSGAAAVGNDSIVAVMVYVKTATGLPVAGLAEGAFSLYALQSPAPGFALTFVQTAVCAACFAEQAPGVYRLALRPISGDWGDGTYIAQLEITSGAISRKIMLPVDVPN